MKPRQQHYIALLCLRDLAWMAAQVVAGHPHALHLAADMWCHYEATLSTITDDDARILLIVGAVPYASYFDGMTL